MDIDIRRTFILIKKLKNYSNQSDTNFINKVWMKDIYSFQKRFGFKYSTYLIFNYNKQTELKANEHKFAVNDFYSADGGLSVALGKKVLESGWELGLHGYNHMSLTLTKPEQYDSKPWSSREAMVKALNVAHKEWELLYSASTLPFSYVAPHNIIDKTGLSALAEAFPSIKVVSTLYIGKQCEKSQEFEWTKDRRFYQIPRMTSGHHMNYSDRYIFYDVNAL